MTQQGLIGSGGQCECRDGGFHTQRLMWAPVVAPDITEAPMAPGSVQRAA